MAIQQYVKNPGQPNAWWHKWARVIVQKPHGGVTISGGTLPVYDDYIVGEDGTGLYAEFKEPDEMEQVIAMSKNVRLTHSIEVRYDDRIKENMRLKWWFNGVTHIAQIHKVTNVNYAFIWMRIDAVETVFNPQAYQGVSP